MTRQEIAQRRKPKEHRQRAQTHLRQAVDELERSLTREDNYLEREITQTILTVIKEFIKKMED